MTPPDPDDKKQEPVSREASEMDPRERQFWDLDEDDGLLDDSPEQEQAAPQAESKPSPPGPDAPRPEKEPQEAEEAAPPRRGRTRASDEPPRPAPTEKSAVEKISLLVLAVLLAGLGTWALVIFYRELPTEDPLAEADLPAQGEAAVIADITTYWREPDPATDRGIQPSIKIIPAAELVLGKGDGSGALRIFFQDSEGDLTGDPVTLAFRNGSFTDAKGNTIEAHCTEGFSDLGDFPAYVTGQIEPWFLIVKEGPSASARGSEFKELLRTPIAAEQR